MRRSAVLFVVLAGCGEDVFDPTATCGNGVVDFGEICLERWAFGALDFGQDLGLSLPCSVAITDVDVDGRDEVVTTTPFLRVWRFDPDVDEDPLVPWLTREDRSFSCAIHDPSRDVWFGVSGDRLVVFRLRPNAVYEEVDSAVSEPSGLGEQTTAWDLVMADVDGDSEMELAVHMLDYSLVTFEVGASGAIESFSRVTASNPHSEVMQRANLDGDELDDLVLSDQVHYGSAPATPVTLADPPISTTIADLDGDGLDDMIGPRRRDGPMFEIRRGTPGHGLGDPQLYDAPTYIHAMQPVDFELDGRPELIAYEPESNGSHAVAYQLDSEGLPRRALVLDVAFGLGGGRVLSAELNGDGASDFIITYQGDLLPEPMRYYTIWASTP